MKSEDETAQSVLFVEFVALVLLVNLTPTVFKKSYGKTNVTNITNLTNLT